MATTLRWFYDIFQEFLKDEIQYSRDLFRDVQIPRRSDKQKDWNEELESLYMGIVQLKVSKQRW
jgi:hypothetical protein